MTHLRQALSTASRQIRNCGLASSSKSGPQSQIYRFKTTATNTNTNTKKLTSMEQYKNEKQAGKDRRTEQYNNKINRRAGLGSRQNPENKNHKKNEFRQWFDGMASKQAYLDREARRQGKQWKINVAAMVERLPIVTPDKHDWELDYFYLKAEMQRYDGVAFPKELGIPDPLDFKVLKMEELMGTYPNIHGFIDLIRENVGRLYHATSHMLTN